MRGKAIASWAAMSFTNERVFILIAILCGTFGCKGAGLVGAVAVTAVRVAAVSAAASHVEREREIDALPPPPPPPMVVVVPQGLPRCVELTPGVDAPPAARAVQCGGRVMVQDGATGSWHDVQVE
jgi:hypothetical protein